MASDIGLVPADGGDYLKLLIAYRRVTEARDAPPSAMWARTLNTLTLLPWQETLGKAGGALKLADAAFPRFIRTVAGAGNAVDFGLERVGCRTPAQLAQASDAALLSISGVGPVRLKRLRDAANGQSFPDDERIYRDN